MCEQSYMIEYVLGFQQPPKKSSDKGNVVHKALEVLSNVSVCVREGRDSYEDHIFGTVSVDRATPEWAVQRSWDYYTSMSSQLDWLPSDLRDCRNWTKKALRYNGGQYDPRQLHVLSPELRFDFEIDEPWARYDYELPDGTRIEGNLSLKGTIDLVVQDKTDPSIIEFIDWKTGARKDWSKEGFNKKTYEELRLDPQLSLYHYAVSKIYPHMDEVFVTIFYINDGGPFSFCFERDDLARTEDMIRLRFEKIRDTKVPHLNVGKRCTSFCHFGKTMSPIDPSKTICEFFKDKVRQDGIERVTEKYGNAKSYLRYGTGGGRNSQA
jgi:hypothetical protein